MSCTVIDTNLLFH